MNKIIDFAKFKTDKELYPQELKYLLSTLPQELRDKIREAIEIPINEYKPLILEDINLSVPNEMTEEQKVAIQEVIIKQRQAILELMQKVILANVAAVMEKHKSS